ncbi:hypothetical protein D3C76_1439920 [compost metagenome]
MKPCSASLITATGSTASESPESGRAEISSSRTHFDMRSTWLMMSAMFFCSGGSTSSWASSALERIEASGLRRLWATAEDISPRATKVSLAISWLCCRASRPEARRTIQ